MAKPISGFPGYTISSSGTVKNSQGKTVAARADDDGYLRVDLYRDGKRFTRFVHSLVNEAFGSKDKEVDHKNGDRKDNRSSNLEGVSRKENVRRIYKRK